MLARMKYRTQSNYLEDRDKDLGLKPLKTYLKPHKNKRKSAIGKGIHINNELI